MKKRIVERMLMAACVVCTLVVMTGCDELMAALDNPVKSYLQVETSTVELFPGETVTRAGKSINTDAIQYESSNPTVATVDATGKVTAIAPGVATIQLSVPQNEYYLGERASYQVKVFKVMLQEKALIGVGDYETLDFDLQSGEGAGVAVEWTSSDESVATVDVNGVVTAVADGKATVTVKVASRQASCAVTVKTKTKLDNIGEDYTVQDGEVLTGFTDKPVKIAAEATVVMSNAWIYSPGNPVTCLGNATIITAEGKYGGGEPSTSEQKAALKVGPAGTTLTLKGKGNLYITGKSVAAAIGTDVKGTCGNIVIESGYVAAQGGSFGVGIGAGDGGTCGDITIHGGQVIASSASYGAAIGCGDTWYGSTTCGNITITGGKVTATATSNAAGIGTGVSRVNKTNRCGDITISGGTVVATKGVNATYDVGPGDNSTKDTEFMGTVGKVTVSVPVKDADGNDATIYQ